VAADLSSTACDLPVAVYTPSRARLDCRALARAMWRDLLAARELGFRLFMRDVSAQYRQSLLGIAWALLPALATGLVFIALQSQRVFGFGETQIPYPVYALLGTTFWQIFADALNAPLKAVTAAKPILARIPFPREALIVSSAYTVIFSALIKSVVLVGVLVWFDVPAAAGLFAAPMAVLLLILLGLAVGLALTPIGLLYTDVAAGLVIATQLWFFATPVVYPAPEAFPLSLLATLNPVSPLLAGARDLTATGTLTDPTAFFAMGLVACTAFVGAWLLYRIALPVLIERMSA
jgi:lipopolysaccharide transport system permease protein